MRDRRVEGCVSSAAVNRPPSPCSAFRRRVEPAGALEPLDPLVQRLRLQPFAQRLRPVELKDPAAPGPWIKMVAELRHRPGAQVAEGQRAVRNVELVGKALRVLLGLDLHAGEREALLLGFQDADGLAVDEEEVVDLAVSLLELHLAGRHARSRKDVHLGRVLDDPAGLFELAVDLDPGVLLRVEVRRWGHRSAP